MTDQVWLTLSTSTDGSYVQVGIDREEALSMTVEDFEELYRKSVYGSPRSEAREWAEKQIKERDAIARATA